MCVFLEVNFVGISVLLILFYNFTSCFVNWDSFFKKLCFI